MPGMDRLQAMEVFVAVVGSGGFAAAARRSSRAPWPNWKRASACAC